MARTIKVSVLVTRIRQLAGDDVAPYRHDDTNIYSYIDDGQEFIIGEHPEAQYIDSITHDDLVPITQLTQDLQVSSAYVNALRDYVVSKLAAEDQEDSANLALSNNSMVLAEGEME